MTNDTTDNASQSTTASSEPSTPTPTTRTIHSPPPRRREKRRVWPWALSLVINGLIVVGLYAYADSVFTLDRQAEVDRTKQVKDREQARAALEKKRRAMLPVTPEQARELTQRKRRQARQQMRARIEKIREDREKMRRIRKRSFDQLHKRKREDLVRPELEPVRRELNTVQKKLEDSIKSAVKPEQRKAQKQTKKKVEEAKKLVETTMKNPAKYEENRKKIVDAANFINEEAKKAYKDVHKRIRATRTGSKQWHKLQPAYKDAAQASRQSDGLKEEADKLMKALDPGKMNDTSKAHKLGDEPDAAKPGSNEQDPAKLYDAAKAMEGQVKSMSNDVKAAKLANSQNTSFDKARQTVEKGASKSRRPSLASAIHGKAQAGAQSHQGKGTPRPSNKTEDQSASSSSKASASNQSQHNTGGGPTIASVRAENAALHEAQRQVGQMEANTRSMVAQAQGGGAAQGAVTGLARIAAMHRAASKRGFADMSGAMQRTMGGGNGASVGMHDHQADLSAEGATMTGDEDGPEKEIEERFAKANALPGRVFTDHAKRRGWLYIDTWYVIGPWENRAKVNWHHVHPPEIDVNFDATYTDGKFKGKPLRWQFVQSDRMDISPPNVHGGSTYYAYTEVYSDRPRDVLVAAAADDAGRLWINGDVIWQEHGQSAWHMGESIRRIRLRRGVNTVLLRLENGPGHAIWSLLLAPPDILRGKTSASDSSSQTGG